MALSVETRRGGAWEVPGGVVSVSSITAACGRSGGCLCGGCGTPGGTASAVAAVEAVPKWGPGHCGIVSAPPASRIFLDRTPPSPPQSDGGGGNTPPPPGQRVRMCGGERPIGTAKGKQSDPQGLVPPPPPRGSGGGPPQTRRTYVSPPPSHVPTQPRWQPPPPPPSSKACNRQPPPHRSVAPPPPPPTCDMWCGCRGEQGPRACARGRTGSGMAVGDRFGLRWGLRGHPNAEVWAGAAVLRRGGPHCPCAATSSQIPPDDPTVAVRAPDAPAPLGPQWLVAAVGPDQVCPVPWRGAVDM